MLRPKTDKASPILSDAAPEFMAVDGVALADSRLQSMGYSLAEQSESGSRRYSAPHLPDVRVADHSPDEATGLWMERNGVLEIRVDRYDVNGQLERLSTIVGGKKQVLTARGLSV